VRMARPSQLHGRLLALLDAARNRAGVSKRLGVVAVLSATALVIPLAAAESGPARSELAGSADMVVDAEAAGRGDADAGGSGRTGWRITLGPAQACWDTERRDVSLHHTVNRDVRVLRVTSRDCYAEILVEGELRFSPDFAAIAWISPGGVFRAIEERGRSREELIARPARDGSVELTWLVDGRARPFDAEAADRLTETLLIFFRRTGYAAEDRVAWLLGQGGASAVLDEILELQSNSARRAYSESLVRREPLDTPTLVRLMRDGSRRITSNSQLSAVLGAVAERYPL
jgi:hypothetical protein